MKKGVYFPDALVVLPLVFLVGCATGTIDPQFGTERAIPFSLERIQTQSEKGLTARLAIPTEEEISQFFGVSLAEHEIQPVWLRVENTSNIHYWILPIAIDPDYYTADETAIVVTENLKSENVTRVSETLRQSALPFFLRAGSIIEGYVYTPHVTGGRFVDVRFSGRRHGVRLRFAVLLPTQGFDYEYSDLRRRYAQVTGLPDLSANEARQRIRELPCCTTTKDGKGEGDPVNLVLVGSGEQVVSALTASGWAFTEAISADSIRRLIGAAIAEKSMLTAPVSALYLFGRKQDIALQRGRSRIEQRNHMRLWLAPFRMNGEPVWVGQVSRDIGVKVTSKSPTLTTHIIDPNVDESRQYVLHALLVEEAVAWFAPRRSLNLLILSGKRW